MSELRGYAKPGQTLGDALREAHEAIDKAVERRNTLILHAHEKEGASYRQIGAAIGVTASTVMRWIGRGGNGREKANPLDRPAFFHQGEQP